MSEKSRLVTARDGHVAREVEAWNAEKLFYVDRYMDIFCQGMKNCWSRLVYADLLAGPGVCCDSGSKEEAYGSPLLAINHPEFRRFLFNDADSRVTQALSARIAERTDADVRVATADCNSAVAEAREFLFPAALRNTTLGLAVIDPTAFQMRFDSISRLTEGVHLDLLIIFMVGYVKRFIMTAAFEDALDQFYGTKAWRNILAGRSQGDKITSRKLLNLYEEQLSAIGYVHYDDDARILNSTRSTIYHIVFASRHPTGKDFFRKISNRRYDGQRRLL